tara:strand:- start:5792 stop:6283 length:492 start_codon:yes stop_codon:yes gene_type:complete
MATQRKIWFINPRFQLKFTFYICTWILVLSLVYPVIIYELFDHFMEFSGLLTVGVTPEQIAEMRNDLLSSLIWIQFAYLSIVFAMGIFLSHRIAGPLYRLKMYFSQLKQGDLQSRLSFRKRDHFQDVALAYNEMLAGLNAKLEEAIADLDDEQKQKVRDAFKH